ncbi:hypothetical protein C358_07075 [Cryptococcus neoformans MW-RSA852]|nr:hypothetical protein C358_07075 [Cryptococcus neoformans var. grubii MW-RSA852]
MQAAHRGKGGRCSKTYLDNHAFSISRKGIIRV